VHMRVNPSLSHNFPFFLLFSISFFPFSFFFPPRSGSLKTSLVVWGALKAPLVEFGAAAVAFCYID